MRLLASSILLLLAASTAWAWQPGGVLVASGPYDLRMPRVVADGEGGALVLWSAFVPGGDLLRCQHLGADGAPRSGWPPEGLGLGLHALLPTSGVLPDGAGGWFVSWSRYDSPMLQRISASGEIAPGWPAQGLELSTQLWFGSPIEIASDGEGGVFASWIEDMSADSIHAHVGMLTHVLADGSLAPDFPVGGRPHHLEVATSTHLDMLPLPGGGFYGVWGESDSRYPESNRLMATQFDADGAIADGWPKTGVDLCPGLPGYNLEPFLIPDGAGGCFVAWNDDSAGGHKVYAQHLLSSATVDPRWPASGLRISLTGDRHQESRSACEDGAGGFLIAWEEARSYRSQAFVQRIRVDGTIHPAWPVGGLLPRPDPATQVFSNVVPDGEDGCYLTWLTFRGGANHEVNVEHLTSLGASAPGWPGEGVSISTTTSHSDPPEIAADSMGGAILAWLDGAGRELRVQRFVAGGVVAARVSLVSAEATPEQVCVVWQVEGEASATVERRIADGLWRVLTRLERDGEGRMRLEDTDVIAGATYDYRLAFADGTRAGETRVTVPADLSFALEGARPNPSLSRVALAFTLAEPGDARLELVDLAGRRIAGRMLAGASAGRQVVPLTESPLSPGLYWAVLTQGANSARARVVVMR